MPEHLPSRLTPGALCTALLEHSSDAAAVVDAAGVVRYASPPLERALGAGAGELNGTDLLDRIHPDDEPAVRALLGELAAAPGERRATEYRIRRNDHVWVTLDAVATGRTDHPEIRGIVLNARDVTEHRVAVAELELQEQKLRQAQKMEAVGRLAGGVAHDFNNLLAVITGYAMLLRGALPAEGPSHDRLAQIRRAADRAADLTRQLLAFSRQQRLEPRTVDLNELVAGTTKMLDRLIGADVELVAMLRPSAGHVRVDPGQIEQVLLNLAVNARDAMPEGGRLIIETAAAELDPSVAAGELFTVPAGRYVELRVSDTGFGMSAAVRAQVFEPFFTTKEAGKGTGLGLSTVYGIVKQSGGYIWIDSEPGAGTLVRIYLPQVEADAERPANTPEPRSLARGSETILVAEDEGALRDLMRTVLEDSGYTVLDAGNGRAALEVAAAHGGSIHLLLADVVMPQMGGRSAYEQMRPDRPEMRVLYTSGYTGESIIRPDVLEPGAAFLPKPFTPETLTRRVREVLDAG